MSRFRAVPFNLAAAGLLFVGCAGSSALTSTSESELTTAQCSARAANAEVDSCFSAFDACRALEGADVDACRATLHSCLPLPPAGGGRGHGGGACDGADGGQPGGHGPEGHPPPPLDGFDGGRPPGGPHGGEHRPPFPEPAEVVACHDAAAAALTAGADATATRETERQCVRAAFQAAFEARCADVAATCAADPSAAECGRPAERCAEGIDGAPPSADGGLVCP